jgi:hypothetical protein
MSWWLFLQLVLLIFFVGLVVVTVANNFVDNLYLARRSLDSHRRDN